MMINWAYRFSTNISMLLLLGLTLVVSGIFFISNRAIEKLNNPALQEYI